jgi:hypothetical protein
MPNKNMSEPIGRDRTGVCDKSLWSDCPECKHFSERNRGFIRKHIEAAEEYDSALKVWNGPRIKESKRVIALLKKASEKCQRQWSEHASTHTHPTRRERRIRRWKEIRNPRLHLV